MNHEDRLRNIANFFENEDYAKTHFPSYLIVPLAADLRGAAKEIERLRETVSWYFEVQDFWNKHFRETVLVRSSAVIELIEILQAAEQALRGEGVRDETSQGLVVRATQP